MRVGLSMEFVKIGLLFDHHRNAHAGFAEGVFLFFHRYGNLCISPSSCGKFAKEG